METYIFLNSDIISQKIKKRKKNSKDNTIICKVLINGSIVAINVHELNHIFHNYYYLSKNGKESLKTPRKKDIMESEGSYYMEKLLFGRVLIELTLRQVLYILNEENYKKSLSQYRLDFLQLKDEDCQCKGIFQDYFKIYENIKEFSDYTVIRFKSYFNNIPYISIKLKNDVLGFPNFHYNN